MENTKSLYLTLRDLLKPHLGKEIIVVCVGTDRSTGDSLGPFVGSHLEKRKLKTIQVYGTIDQPVHAVNLEERMAAIFQSHPGAFIIGIDSALGRRDCVGEIRVRNKPLKPGEGVKKELMEVGECSITGIVNVVGFMEYFVLGNTRLSEVIKMSNEIANLIKGVDNYVSRKVKTLGVAARIS
ncbi:spore protease YyaC [Sutcliffiella horikoshii]|uniref:Spore protease YyaC n=1 Tax=Sutcliffiella horikoshii TaxID=79883 RepID=A0A5D4SA51_9BACI|nr:spore protease YyaC [Sutcliffiella horikoshii]TYS60493.1 spore protease YyaC [Sutcliffiella horikoshii]